MITDVHGTKKSLERLKVQLKSYSGKNGLILEKYLTWHELQLERKTMKPSSVIRSLGIALIICDRIPNVSLMETAPLERFWSDTLSRNATKKSNGKIIQMKQPLSTGSFHKIRTQLIKFYKFISFLNKYPEKEISLFQSNLMPKPDCCTFLTLTESKQREDFNLPNQNQVKELIEELFKSKNYYAKMAGVFVAISNDSGLRFSEIATLKKKDVELVENFFLLGISESKTAKRTVISALAKKFIQKWDEMNDKKRVLFFESLEHDGDTPIVYNSLRKYMHSAAKKLDVPLVKGHAFHTFRHCASSRLRDMPGNQKKYFMGWKLDGLENIYTRISWEDCKKAYFESLKGNPMLDFSLSEYEEKQQSQEESWKEMIRAAVRAELGKSKG